MNPITRIFAAIAWLCAAAVHATEGTHVPAEDVAAAIRQAIEEAEPRVVEIEREVEVVREVEVPVDDATEDRLSVSYAYVDAGDCPEPGHTVVSEYLRSSPDTDFHARVRTAPSGGDCRVDGLSFAVGGERRFPVAGWYAVAKFGASRQSTAAPYAIVDAQGDVLTRPDGGPSDPVVLPAGAAETILGSLGFGRDLGFAAVEAAVNFVPTDWADGTAGRTIHFGASSGFDVTVPLPGGPGLEVAVDAHFSVDVGNDAFGEFAVSATTGILRAAVRHSFGLDVLDAGVPATQTFAGLPAVALGAPQAHSTSVEVGASWSF